MHSSITLDSLRFDELTIDLLYEILRLRAEVFIVEQTCYYQDVDGIDRDPEARHVLFRDNDILVGYARVLPPGSSYKEYSSIGRILTAESHRRQKLGHEVVREGIRLCQSLWPEVSIKISAQSRLEKFYNQHGFYVAGEGYLEDGIPHIPMVHSYE